MFTGSEIVKGYKQQETKIRYILVHGIGPHFRELLKDELKQKVYSYHFDKTTTSQAKKQYDGYVTFCSELDSQVISMYCGTLFVGGFPAKMLKEHMFEFLSKVNLCPSNLLSIGMDGPSVNIKFHEEVSEELNKSYNGKTLVNVGTCQLHIANNVFF